MGWEGGDMGGGGREGGRAVTCWDVLGDIAFVEDNGVGCSMCWGFIQCDGCGGRENSY